MRAISCFLIATRFLTTYLAGGAADVFGKVVLVGVVVFCVAGTACVGCVGPSFALPVVNAFGDAGAKLSEVVVDVVAGVIVCVVVLDVVGAACVVISVACGVVVVIALFDVCVCEAVLAAFVSAL